jgi:hypothetical protein
MKYFLLLMLIASPAWAEWEELAKNERGALIFLNRDTIRQEGSRVKFWQLTNLAKPNVLDGREYLSMRSRVEIDCKQEKQRFMTITAFASLFASGERISEITDVGQWRDIAPDSVSWKLLKTVCMSPVR